MITAAATQKRRLPDEDLKDHLQRHEDVYDKLIERNSRLLVGDNGDNGLCKSMTLMQESLKQIEKRLSSIEGWMKWLATAVGTSIVGALIYLILSHGAEIAK